MILCGHAEAERAIDLASRANLPDLRTRTERVATLAMSRIRKTSLSLLAVLIAAGLIHELGLLPFETEQAVAAGFGMVVGVAILGLACWEFPKIRMDITGAGYPGFLGQISIAALLGGFAGYWIFTIMVVGWGRR